MQPYKPTLKPFSRSLRTSMTDAEQMLWSKLRRKQILGVQFYRQKPLLGYIVDFYSAAAKLVIELDGSQHFEPDHQAADIQRDRDINALGLLVLRFNNLQVLNELDAVMSVIFKVVEQQISMQIPPRPPFVQGGGSAMNAIQTLLTDNLDLWTSALLTKSTAGRGSSGKLEAYGIKKLRELILELAVCGKLVPQDPKDEPAKILSELDKELVAQSSFEIPQGWGWYRLRNLAEINGGFAFKSTDYKEDGMRVIRISDFDEFGFKNHKIVRHPFTSELAKFCLDQNNILMAMTGGTVGKSYLVRSLPEPMIVNQRVATIKVSTYASPSYIDIVIRSEMTQEVIREAKNSTNDNISMGDIKGFAIPLPPMVEQHRIVAKVDELMALCDQLEQQQTHSIEAHQTLVETLLGTLTRVESQQEFSAAWARIASHFDTLFTTAASIDQLKQTILQLAVMGKLVPQDPNDEPASVLLEKVAEAKERLISEGRIKRQKPLPEISEEEKEFELPTNWEWCRFQDITRLITDGKHGDCNNLSNSGFYFLSAKDIQNGELLYENARQIVPSEFEEVHQRTNLQPGDICMVNTGATVGKMAIATDNKLTYRTTFQKSVAVIKVATPFVDLRYIGNYLQAETPKLLHKSGGSAINNLLLGDLKKKLVPLPPINEQIKIVAKVDELMALCGTLKARLADAQSIQLHLADAIVEQAVC